jgi:hypothetical protein
MKILSNNPKPLTTAELDKLYDRIYYMADKAIKKHNPCQIEIVGEKIKCRGVTEPEKSVCCGGCPYMRHGTGCMADKPIFCKLYFCGRPLDRGMPKMLLKLSLYIDKYLYPDYYVDKKTLMNKSNLRKKRIREE